jgi:hypothetical protein
MNDRLLIAGAEVHAHAPEGVAARMPVDAFVRRLAPPVLGTGEIVLPDGVRALFSGGAITVIVYEIPPQVATLQWVTDASAARYGAGTLYAPRTLSLPYMVLVLVLARDSDNKPALTKRNELFFAHESLAAPRPGRPPALDDPALLRWAALKNVSRYKDVDMRKDGKSLAWYCTHNWRGMGEINREPDVGRRVARAINGLVQYLFASSYNDSSEYNPLAKAAMELESWYTSTVRAGVIGSVEEWAALTRLNPRCGLEIPWLETGYTVRQVAQRIIDMHNPVQPPQTATDLARVVFNHAAGLEDDHDYPHTLW